MTLRIFNTLTMQKEDFTPLEPGKVRMYVCGVTVYDYCHVGHARAAIVFDTIYRYLLHRGYDVTYVRNFTDIDDKIINRAKEEGIDWKDVTKKYIDAFYEDMGQLNIAIPTTEPKATEHIDAMLKLIRSLVDQGKAYESEGDVYYSIKTFPDYGKLSGRNIDDLQAGARVEPGEHKQDPLDFALWKKSKPGEPAWDSPWGPGRPGWHIECSAMGRELLGEVFDIHGGGKDLVFPHHENEIAQSQGCSGKPPVRYWIHNGFVNINKEKMSKSLGNFFTIRDILKQFHPEVLRLLLLTNHYRGPIDFADQYLEDAKKMLNRFYDLINKVDYQLGPIDSLLSKLKNDKNYYLFKDKAGKNKFLLDFEKAMDDDFNTALGLAHMNEELTRINREIDQLRGESEDSNETKKKSAVLLNDAIRWYYCGKDILGMFHSNYNDYLFWKNKNRGIDKEKVEALIKQRNEARSDKDWAKADACRDALLEMGVVLKDGKEGTTWEVQ